MNGLGMVKVQWEPCDASEHSVGLNVNSNRNNETHAGSRLILSGCFLRCYMTVITY